MKIAQKAKKAMPTKRYRKCLGMAFIAF